MKTFFRPLLLGALVIGQIACTSTPAPEKAAAPPAETPAPDAAKSATPPPAETPATAAKAEPPAAKSAKEAKAAPATVAKAIPPPAPAAKAAPKAVGGDLMNPATMNAKAPATFQAKFTTTKGDFVIEVTRAWAPNGADHFYNMVRGGYYTDAAFFRVVPGFMVQFGISAKPEVSRIWAERKIMDDPVTQSNTRGMLTYAQTSAPNSRSTQLFINFGNNTFLDNQRFAPFGKVTEGMDVVDSIYSGYGEQPDQFAITNQGKPYLDKSFPRLDRIVSATIVPAGAQ